MRTVLELYNKGGYYRRPERKKMSRVDLEGAGATAAVKNCRPREEVEIAVANYPCAKCTT